MSASSDERAALLELLDPAGSEVRAGHALFRLGESRDVTLVEPLLAYLERDQRQNVQIAGVRALGMLRDKRAIPFLQSRVPQARMTRGYALASLVAIGGPEAIRALRALLSHDDPYLRRQIAQALAKIGGPDAAEALGHALFVASPPWRGAIPKALATVGGIEAVNELRDALQFADARLRRQIVAALGAIGSAEAVAVLRDLGRVRTQ